VRVVPIDFPNPDFTTEERKEILARSLRGEGDGIDLLAVDVGWVQRFAKWSEPLGRFFTRAELDRILGHALLSCYADTQLVAVPLDLVQGVMYYREDKLKKARGGERIIRALGDSLTWPAFIALCRDLPPDGPVYIFPAADYEGLTCIYVEILSSLRPDYFSRFGFRFDTPEAETTLQLLVDLVQRYRVTPRVVAGFTEVPSYEYFIRHDGYFLRGWTTYGKDFEHSRVDSVKELGLRRAPLPRMAGGVPASVFGGWNLIISRYSTKKEATVEFMKFLLSNESQEEFYVSGGYYPIVKSFYEDTLYLRRYPEITGMNRLMKTGVHRPQQAEYTKYSKIMSRYFSMAIEGALTVDEALHRTTRAIREEHALVRAD
jgi:multiple sugar transport system substrate-binding protein